MQDWFQESPMAVVYIFMALAFISMVMANLLSKKVDEWRLNARRAVTKETKYANNHHVSDVGYYHATSGVWYPEPWNSYREGKGYYWDGIWHPEPDERIVTTSVPQPDEVDRVNRLWFAADPMRQRYYNEYLKRSGFGGSSGRTSGS
jgi:hypothetical protein